MSRTPFVAVIEDHDVLREMTVDLLRQANWCVCGYDSAESFCEAGHVHPVDVVILDVQLPGEDGLSLAARLRECQPDLGIVMLTVCDAIQQRVQGYAQGADIYLAKPMVAEELVAAVSALLRRLMRPPITASAWSLDSARCQLVGAGTVVPLHAPEAALLRAFAMAVDHTLDTWQIQEIVGSDESTRLAVAIRMSRLRKKLLQAGAHDPVLRSVRGRGYRLLVDLTLT
jgi:DNA-binding response OmpR family regulator